MTRYRNLHMNIFRQKATCNTVCEPSLLHLNVDLLFNYSTRAGKELLGHLVHPYARAETVTVQPLSILSNAMQ